MSTPLRKIRNAGFAICGAAVAATAVIVQGSPALAVPPQDCLNANTLLCVYQFNNGGGGALYTSNSNNNWDFLGNPNAFQFMNDKASSASNNTTQTYARIWQNDDLQGNTICMAPGRNYPDFPDSINDKSSSHKFYSGC